MTLGDIIKEYRSEHAMNMRDFATRSGLSRAYVSLLERNINPKTGKEITPSIEVIKKVADAVGKSFDEIFNSIDCTTKIIVNSTKVYEKLIDEDFPVVDEIFNKTTSFSNRLKLLRAQKQISQQELANIIGISKSSINMYERGEREPGFETFEAIADYFNVDTDYLLGRQDVERKINISGTYAAPVSKQSNFNFHLSSHEGKVVGAYRKHTEMQPAVDKLLGVAPEKFDHLTPIAAHELPGSSKKAIKNDDDIMKDDKF